MTDIVERLRALQGWRTIDDIKLLLDAADEIERLEAENTRLNERVKLLTDTLEEILDQCKDEYDLDPDPSGGHDDRPNIFMRFGTMIEETLYGPGVHW